MFRDLFVSPLLSIMMMLPVWSFLAVPIKKLSMLVLPAKEVKLLAHLVILYLSLLSPIIIGKIIIMNNNNFSTIKGFVSCADGSVYYNIS